MTTDPFPALTTFLETILLYLIYLGAILAAISAVVSGIMFLPIFGFDARRSEIGAMALKATFVGILVIVLAIPGRNAILHFFPLPPGVPVVPLAAPVPTPTPTP